MTSTAPKANTVSDRSRRPSPVYENSATFQMACKQLEQVVNGKPVALGPGGIVSIRSTDQVRHKSGPIGAKVLVIWAPGGEIDRVTARWKVR